MSTNYPEISRTADAIEAIQFYFYYRMGWNLQDVSPSYVALQIPYGSSAFDNIINLGTREMLNYAHSNNIAVQYWTINSEEEVRTLTLNGAAKYRGVRPFSARALATDLPSAASTP